MYKDSEIKRLWDMIHLLESDREMTCLELASHFHVSTRTMKRDIIKLQQAGVPLHETIAEHGRKYWTLAEKKNSIGQTEFSYDEVATLYLSRPFLEPLFGTFLWDAAESALGKMRKRLGQSAIRHLEQLLDVFPTVENNKSHQAGKSSILETLIIGCEECREIRITYRSITSNKDETYSIRPYELINAGGSFYINGYSCKSLDVRQWKLNRMSAALKTNVRFERPTQFHFEPFSQPDHEKQRYVVRFAPVVARYVQERNWHDSEKLTENADGSILAEYELSSPVLLKSYVLSYGPHAEIIEPESLRHEILKDIETMRKNYQK